MSTQPLKKPITVEEVTEYEEGNKPSQNIRGIKRVRYLRLVHNDTTEMCACRCIGHCSCDCDRKTF